MKLESVYEYIVLSHYLNFTTAAQSLHLSQPNLSKHIAELEGELGVQLFNRGQALELTAAGRTFLEDAIQMHHLYKLAVKRCREADARKTETLAIQEPYAIDAMSEILFKSVMRAKQSRPHIATKYYAERNKKSIELLEQGKLDIALTVDCCSTDWIEQASKKKDLIFYPVVREPLMVWMWELHPLMSRETITLDDLAQVPIAMTTTRAFDPMRYALIDLFQNALGVPPNLRTSPAESLNEFFMNTEDKSAVFLVSPAVATSPLLQMHADMVVRPIADERARITSYFVFKADYQKHAIDEFLEVVDDMVAHGIAQNPDASYLKDIATPWH